MREISTQCFLSFSSSLQRTQIPSIDHKLPEMSNLRGSAGFGGGKHINLSCLQAVLISGPDFCGTLQIITILTSFQDLTQLSEAYFIIFTFQCKCSPTSDETQGSSSLRLNTSDYFRHSPISLRCNTTAVRIYVCNTFQRMYHHGGNVKSGHLCFSRQISVFPSCTEASQRGNPAQDVRSGRQILRYTMLHMLATYNHNKSQ